MKLNVTKFPTLSKISASYGIGTETDKKEWMKFKTTLENFLNKKLGSDEYHLVERGEDLILQLGDIIAPDVNDETPLLDSFLDSLTELFAQLKENKTYKDIWPNWESTEQADEYRIYIKDEDGMLEASSTDRLPGGKGDNKQDSEFDSAQLEKGIEHEKEHTNDKEIAKEIAKDHLSEDPKYYDHVKSNFPALGKILASTEITGDKVLPVVDKKVEGHCYTTWHEGLRKIAEAQVIFNKAMQLASNESLPMEMKAQLAGFVAEVYSMQANAEELFEELRDVDAGAPPKPKEVEKAESGVKVQASSAKELIQTIQKGVGPAVKSLYNLEIELSNMHQSVPGEAQSNYDKNLGLLRQRLRNSMRLLNSADLYDLAKRMYTVESSLQAWTVQEWGKDSYRIDLPSREDATFELYNQLKDLVDCEIAVEDDGYIVVYGDKKATNKIKDAAKKFLNK